MKIPPQHLPSTSEVLSDLVKAGGEMPQSAFTVEHNDARDMLWRNGFIECDVDAVRITDKGRAALA